MMNGFQVIIDALSKFDWLSLIVILLISIVLFLKFKFLVRVRYEGFIVIMLAAQFVGIFICAFNLPVLSDIFKYALIISLLFASLIYWQEIKRTLQKFGKFGFVLQENESSEEELEQSTHDIVRAVQNLAKKDIGALIIIVKNEIQDGVIESGTRLDSIVSSQLLESIFNPKTPLHDGAVIIKGNKIISAGCFLPLSQELNIPKEFGTRHRAGIGITEGNDVLAIVVSEETGIISVCQNGLIKKYIDSKQLQEIIGATYGLIAYSNTSSGNWAKKGSSVSSVLASDTTTKSSSAFKSFSMSITKNIGFVLECLISGFLFWLIYEILLIVK